MKGKSRKPLAAMSGVPLGEAAQLRSGPIVVWTFDDGSTESRPLEEAIADLRQVTLAGAACHEDSGSTVPVRVVRRRGKGTVAATTVPAADFTPLPLGKGRALHFDRLYGIDPELDTILSVEAHLRQHPDAAAQAWIEKALQAIHLDPAVTGQSPELARFVWLMRELLTDFIPGMTLEQMLEPLHTVLSRHPNSGRPSAAAVNAMWLNEYEEKQLGNRTNRRAQEIYEDIAATENERRSKTGSKPIKWKRIRDGISEARKSSKNPV